MIVVVLVGGAYLYRSQISSMFSGAYSTPATVTYSPAAISGSPAAAGAVLSWNMGVSGQYAVGSNGMTLYWSNKDTKGVSNCTGSCASIWPPYTTTTTPKNLPANVTLITRSDGSMQFAYKGMPLYYYSGDQKVGDTNGSGFNNGQWNLVNP